MAHTAFAGNAAKAAARELRRGIVTAVSLRVDERGDIDKAGFRHHLGALDASCLSSMLATRGGRSTATAHAR
jgi:hypothetical protein